MSEKPLQSSRRAFVRWLTTGMVTIIGAVLGGVLAAFSIPRAAPGSTRWIRVTDAAKLSSETFRPYRLRVQRAQGWHVSEVEEVVYARRTASGPLVLGATCTHLGCAVRWRTQTHTFECPCHGGVYTDDGSVAGGPPPRPLERFRARESSGVLEIEIT